MANGLLAFLAWYHGLRLSFSSVAPLRRSHNLELTTWRDSAIVGLVVQGVVEIVHLRAAEAVAVAAWAGL